MLDACQPAFMPDWSPPAIPRSVIAVVCLVLLVELAYAVLIRGSILIGVLPGLVLVVAYVVWRFLVAFEAIAVALHRLADERQEQ